MSGIPALASGRAEVGVLWGQAKELASQCVRVCQTTLCGNELLQCNDNPAFYRSFFGRTIVCNGYVLNGDLPAESPRQSFHLGWYTVCRKMIIKKSEITII